VERASQTTVAELKGDLDWTLMHLVEGKLNIAFLFENVFRVGIPSIEGVVQLLVDETKVSLPLSLARSCSSPPDSLSRLLTRDLSLSLCVGGRRGHGVGLASLGRHVWHAAFLATACSVRMQQLLTIRVDWHRRCGA
jgi:hypothetical protein